MIVMIARVVVVAAIITIIIIITIDVVVAHSRAAVAAASIEIITRTGAIVAGASAHTR